MIRQTLFYSLQGAFWRGVERKPALTGLQKLQLRLDFRLFWLTCRFASLDSADRRSPWTSEQSHHQRQISSRSPMPSSSG